MGLDRLTPSPLRGTRRLRRAGSGGGRLGGRAILPRGRRGRARRARADVEIGGVAGGEAERQPGHVGLLLRGRSTFGGSRWQRSGKTKAAWVAVVHGSVMSSRRLFSYFSCLRAA